MEVVVKQEPMSCWPSLELNRACEWCSSPDYMRGVIEDYVHKPLDEWQELLLDLCYCYDCVQEYHRLADEAWQNSSALFQEFLTLDIERLTHTIAGALESSAEDVLTKLQVPLMEVLGFPYLLHHKQLADQFVDGIIAVLKFSYPLKLEEKLPGAYLLLIHPNEKVRAWATRSARSLGLINRDDYDILVEVIEWMLGVVTFDISSNLIALDDIAIHKFLPPHLFVTPSFSEYWTGLVVLVMQMDFATVQSCLMSSDENGHRDFLVTIMSNLQDQMEEEGPFWSVLQCFTVFIEKLGERIWQMPSFHYQPNGVFNIITSNAVYTNYIQKRLGESEVTSHSETATYGDSKRRLYKTALVWFRPFVESFLDFESGELCVCEVLNYFHNLAECCSHQSTFKSEVQSLLLTMIHSLVCKELALWLGSTVDLWAGDVLEIAKLGAEEKKRQLQHLLKICFRNGQKTALKYSDMFSRKSLPILSPSDEKEIVSILIRGFKSERGKLIKLEGNVTQPTSPVTRRKRESENKQSFSTIVDERSRSSLEPSDSGRTCAVGETGNDERSSVCNMTIEESGSSVACEFDSEPRKRKIDPTVRSWGKAGPSTYASSSEEDVDEEHFMKMKRRKKIKHQLESSKAFYKPQEITPGASITVRLVDYKQQGKTEKDLLHEREGITGDGPVKDDTQICAKDDGNHQRPKVKQKRFFARKSTGKLGERSSKHRKPDRKRDVEDNVANNLDWKDPLFKCTVKLERTRSNFSDDDEDSDAALGEMMEIFDSQQTTNVVIKSEIQKTIISSKDDVLADSSESSDGELFKSVFDLKTESTSSVTSSGGDIIFPEVKSEVPAPETTAIPDIKTETTAIPDMNEKGETPSRQMDIDLHRERMQLEFMDDVHYSLDFEEDKGEVVGEEAGGPATLQVVTNALQSHSLVNIDLGDVSDRSALKEEGEYFASSNLKTNSEDSEPLSSISRRVENDALDIGIGDFWMNNSELIMNSQENVLASIEDDLAGVYGAPPDNSERESAMFSPEVCRGVVGTSVHQTDENNLSEAKDAYRTSIKSMDFPSDSRPPEVAAATAGTRGSAHPVVSVAKTPAITTPQRALTEDDFFHEILSWEAVDLGSSESRKKTSLLPRRYSVLLMPDRSGFDSMDQYHDTFKPLLFMEIWAKAVNDWMEVNVDKKKVNVEVLDGSSSNKTFLIECCGFISLNQRNKILFPIEHDLVVMSFFSPELRGAEDTSVSGMPYPPVFGIVQKVEVTPTKPSERSKGGSSSEEDTVDSSAFQLKLHIKTTSNFRPPRKSHLSVKFVTQLLTHLRQWVGLMNIAKSLLASDILKPRRAEYFCLNDYKHSTTVSKDYNASQEKVISCGTNAMHLPYPIPRVCLVQGPPGTGKSYTIVGLIKEILNRRQEPAAQPTTGSPVLANKHRILLCAPSNAAIDELIGQIKRARIRLDKKQDNKESWRRNQQSAFQKASLKNCGDVTLVRVGRKSQVHSSVSEFWLETMTKNKLQEKRSVSTVNVNINEHKDDLNACTAELEELEKRIWALQSTPLSANQEKKEKIKDLQQKKDYLKNHRRVVQLKLRKERDKQNHLHREEARIRREILDSADIVCTTLSGAGSTSLKQDYGRCKCPFGCVIVDEACQATELDVLIPLEFKSSKLVLVGDPEQLPPTIISEKAKANAFGLSMFQRLYKFFRHNDLGRPVMMLEEQYRMHPEIASFPSRHFYSSRLKCHRSLEMRPFSLKEHYLVFDVIRGQEVHLERGALCNPTEVRLVVELCILLTRMLHSGSIGIITPYKKQKMDIQQKLSKDFSNIEVNTVDGFQGREKDVVILSCVRAKNNRASIGFVGDKQRMNVALTRARHALFILGDMQTLKSGSNDWMELLEDAKKRECIFAVESFEDMKSHLSADNLRLPVSGTHTETTAVLTKGSNDPSVGSENESLQRLSIAIPSTGELRKEIVPSGSITEGSSVSRCETLHPVLRKTSHQTPRGISRRRVTWADRPILTSTDNGSTSRTHATYEQVQQGGCRRHSASEIGKEYITAMSRSSYGKRTVELAHVSGSSNRSQNDDNYRRIDELSSKGPKSRELITDPSPERRNNDPSNREQSRQEGARHTCTLERDAVSETQVRNEEKVAFKDQDDETGDHRFADQRGSKEPIRHGRKSELPEGDYNHYPPNGEPGGRHTKTDEDRLPSNPVSCEQEKDRKFFHTHYHGFDECPNLHQQIVKRSRRDEQSLGPTSELRGLQPSKQVPTREESAKQHGTSECINLVEDDDSDAEATEMDAQNLSSASESSVPSSHVNLIRGGTDCNGYDMDVMDPADDSQDSNSTQVYNVDPILNSVIKNNRSYSPAYFANLQKQEQASISHSTSARISTTTSITPSSSSANSVSNYVVPSRNSATRSLSSARHSSSYSRTSVSPPSSVFPSSSSRSGNEQPFLSHASVTRRGNSIQGELDPVVQGRANAVAQRHPRSRGPEIIEPGTLFHGMRNPLGSGRQRTAHVTGDDVSSLRARAIGEERQPCEQRRQRRQLIDKRKVCKNFRGRTNWNK